MIIHALLIGFVLLFLHDHLGIGRAKCWFAGKSINNEANKRSTTTNMGTTGLLFFLLVLALGYPSDALALQVHGEPEGLYVHQMAHLFYVLALGYFFWDIRRSSFTNQGWRYLQWFCVLMTLWNVLAFAGHTAGVFLDPRSLHQTDCYLQTQLVGPLTMNKFLYFIAKLDHLLCVPALFFLFLGTRSFYRSVAHIKGKERT